MAFSLTRDDIKKAIMTYPYNASIRAMLKYMVTNFYTAYEMNRYGKEEIKEIV